MYSVITHCRICKESIENYDLILDLGVQALTGVFPRPGETLLKSPVTLIRCHHCGLVQLLETVDPSKMFGDIYGYTSSLNKSMVSHLEGLAKYCKQVCKLESGDRILDIGSNDGTFLKNFLDTPCHLLGMDPSAVKFLDRYEGISILTEFFSKESYFETFNEKAKLVTSIACYYDLEDPIKFAEDVVEILREDGVWILEAAYLPDIIEKNCFDGCCHEHLLYYSLNDIEHIASKVGLFIQDVSFNDTNGGSFRVALGQTKPEREKEYYIADLLSRESFNFDEEGYFSDFTKKVIKFKQDFIKLLSDLKEQDYMIYGLGASTKFNVILQYCNISTDLIYAIYDVNSYKYGRVTPGTNIPIYSEKDNLPLLPSKSALIIGPYHFFDSFMKNPKIKEYIKRGGKVIFPLPNLKII